jgi:membrane-associated phospholipid phosphatase
MDAPGHDSGAEILPSRSPLLPAQLLAIAMVELLLLCTLGVAVGLRWRPVAALDIAVAHGSVTFTRDVNGVHWWATVAQVGQPNVLRLILVLTAVGLLRRRRRRVAAWVLLAVILETLLAPLSKFILDRPRPEWTHPLFRETGTSFPSGHAAAAGMLLTVIVLLGWPWVRHVTRARAAVVLLAGTSATLICLSRIFLGVHYLSDVVGGLLLGSALSLLSYLAVMHTLPSTHVRAATR